LPGFYGGDLRSATAVPAIQFAHFMGKAIPTIAGAGGFILRDAREQRAAQSMTVKAANILRLFLST
jgi:hypothetical protein